MKRNILGSAESRILLIDGAMGTMIQRQQLGDVDYRGKRFANYSADLFGANDLLNLTQPDLIKEIHLAYLEAGADILTTNTFNSNRISMSDYKLERIVKELNFEGACLARQAVNSVASESRPRFVAGTVGPTNRTASISPDVSDPAHRATTFDELRIGYREAAEGLLEGGVDLLLLETVFDTLNAKAALFAFAELFEERKSSLPIMISGTITDRSGRTLTGQTVEAFWCSVRHCGPLSVGLNCSLGAEQLRPYVGELSSVADCLVSAHPNAGFPNEFGEYEETPEQTAEFLHEWAEEGLVNILGGCCGTTPAHVAAIAASVKGISPRALPERGSVLAISGLEAVSIRP